MSAAAVFENVQKDYILSPLSRRKITALRGVSLSIPAGSVFALLGPNRAGKTTLIKLLLSLARATSGSIVRLGQPSSERATLGRIGYMHENHAFPRYLSASEVLHFYGGLTGLSSSELPQRVESLLVRVGLADRKDDRIANFSKGMVQRLGLAQAMLNEPDLLILDEPTEGLDLTGRKLLRSIVRETQAAGKTVIMVSHVLPEVEELCEDLAVIVSGRIAHQGKLNDLTSGRNFESALNDIYEQGGAA